MVKILKAKTLRVLVVALLACLVVSVPAQPFPFVDEGVKDKDFLAFRAKIIAIADKRDLRALRPHIHPKAIESFGGNEGSEYLLRAMRYEPKRWEVLADILRTGGKFRMEGNSAGKQVKTFYAPYTFFADVSEADATVVLTGDDVPVHAEPSTTSRVIKRFNDEALAVVFGDRADNRNWFEIKLPQGGTGFVSAGRAVPNAGDRVGFVYDGGKWKMHVFVAGGD